MVILPLPFSEWLLCFKKKFPSRRPTHDLLVDGMPIGLADRESSQKGTNLRLWQSTLRKAHMHLSIIAPFLENRSDFRVAVLLIEPVLSTCRGLFF
jgi:hypothetical protein